MPVYFNAIEKFFMKDLCIGPAPVFDLSGGFSFFAVDAAIRLDLFETLASKPLEIEELAASCHCDARGLITLVNLLQSLGYIKKKKNTYDITRMTRKWLVSSSKINFKQGFEYYHPTLTEIWPYLTESVRKGNPYINFYEWLNDKPQIAESYQKYMLSLAKMVIPTLLKKIKLKETNILDIGGSHGMYSIALCKKNPSIKVTIIDSSYAMNELKKNIRVAGLEHRISLLTGDFLNYNFDDKFDAALLFNVYHEHEEDYNKKLSSKIYDILNPSGRVIVLEGLETKKATPMIDFMQRIYGLMFFCFLGGQNYSLRDIKSWLKNSGFENIQKKSLSGTGFSIVNAYHKS